MRNNCKTSRPQQIFKSFRSRNFTSTIAELWNTWSNQTSTAIPAGSFGRPLIATRNPPVTEWTSFILLSVGFITTSAYPRYAYAAAANPNFPHRRHYSLSSSLFEVHSTPLTRFLLRLMKSFISSSPVICSLCRPYRFPADFMKALPTWAKPTVIQLNFPSTIFDRTRGLCWF